MGNYPSLVVSKSAINLFVVKGQGAAHAKHVMATSVFSIASNSIRCF